MARQRFAADGYERATIRAIAADARIDPARVMRYCGNKEGLFAAAAEFDLRRPDSSALSRRNIGAARVGRFLMRWEGDDVLKAPQRVGASSDIAAERLRAIVARQALPAISKSCADPAEVPARASLVSSQFLGRALRRYWLKLPPIASMRRVDVIKWLAPTVQRYICRETPA